MNNKRRRQESEAASDMPSKKARKNDQATEEPPVVSGRETRATSRAREAAKRAKEAGKTTANTANGTGKKPEPKKGKAPKKSIVQSGGKISQSKKDGGAVVSGEGVAEIVEESDSDPPAWVNALQVTFTEAFTKFTEQINEMSKRAERVAANGCQCDPATAHTSTRKPSGNGAIGRPSSLTKPQKPKKTTTGDAPAPSTKPTPSAKPSGAQKANTPAPPPKANAGESSKQPIPGAPLQDSKAARINVYKKSLQDWQYPKFDVKTSELADKVCLVFRDLRRYWQLQRMIDIQQFYEIPSKDWIDLEAARSAIMSVTEAIHADPEGEKFVLWPEEPVLWWRLGPEGGKRSFFSRRQDEEHSRRLLLPVWYKYTWEEKKAQGSEEGGIVCTGINLKTAPNHRKNKGHTILVELYQDPESSLSRARIFDSLTSKLPEDDRDEGDEMLFDAIRELAAEIRWGEIVDNSHIEVVPCAEQQDTKEPDNKDDRDVGKTCTLHAILNGWARALNLTPDPEFDVLARADFYQEALGFVNQALAGYVDSALLWSWFMCRRFVVLDTNHASMVGHRFRRSVAVHDAESANNIFNNIYLLDMGHSESELKGRFTKAETRRPSQESQGDNQDISLPQLRAIQQRFPASPLQLDGTPLRYALRDMHQALTQMPTELYGPFFRAWLSGDLEDRVVRRLSTTTYQRRKVGLRSPKKFAPGPWRKKKEETDGKKKNDGNKGSTNKNDKKEKDNNKK